MRELRGKVYGTEKKEQRGRERARGPKMVLNGVDTTWTFCGPRERTLCVLRINLWPFSLSSLNLTHTLALPPSLPLRGPIE